MSAPGEPEWAMMLSMRLICALIFASVLCSMVAACGGAGEHGSAGEGSASTKAAQSATTAAHTAPTSTAEGAPTVVAPSSNVRFVARLPQSDGDADNPRDFDGGPDPDYHIDTDEDTFTAASYRYPDGDERWNFSYGKAASPAQARLLAGLLTRYYEAMRAGDVSTACAILLPSVASKLTPGLEEHAARRPGETCIDALEVAAGHLAYTFSGTIAVTHVRVDGQRALVAYGSRTMFASFIFFRRYGGTWKLEEPLPAPLP